MRARPTWACVGLMLLAGCHTLGPAAPAGPPEAAAEPAAAPAAATPAAPAPTVKTTSAKPDSVPEPAAAPDAQDLWTQGQQAMEQGQHEQAIRLYERSLTLDRTLTRNHLSIAAAYLEQGEQSRAAPHLARYLSANPEHHIVRAHYAELLFRLRQWPEARLQFERFQADVQEFPDLAAKHLVHCHSRLMEIAEQQKDAYAEHLHRGIGLYLVAVERSTLPDPAEGELSVESVLCKAAGELALARLEKRGEARPAWYLYQVWSRLGQAQPATRHLREAAACAPFTYLTATEKRDLMLASLSRDHESPVK